MFEKIPTAGMGRTEWLSLRKTGIGGSDAGAVCGLNPYSSLMKVFYDKTSDETEENDSEAVRIGHDLEDYAARRFSEATGLKVRRSNYMYRSVEHPFMIADVDRLVVNEDAGLECKTASAYNADKWKDGKIPLHYVLQCYHYMAVTGRKAWYIAAVILGKEFTYRKLVWDDALIKGLIEAEHKFWNSHVVPGVIPDPDGSEICDAVLGKHFQNARKGPSIKLDGFDEKLRRHGEIASMVKQLQEEQRKIEQEVKLIMKENENAASEKYRVSWTRVETQRLDAGRIKAERPEIYAEYTKASSSRRFQIKAA